MIPVPPGVRVLLATRPVDFRKGVHGLAAEALGQEPFSGAVIVFCESASMWDPTSAHSLTN